jgi:hypothetical protein
MSRPSRRAMRSLTAAEIRVIDALLADSASTESERARQAGVPPTTFKTVRRRIFSEGWLYERYLPDPSSLGLGALSVTVAQPFVERYRELVEEFRQLPGTVVLLASPETLVSVTLHRSGAAPTGPVRDRTSAFRRIWTVHAELADGGAPVYFDFSGAWSARTSAHRDHGYPRPFGRPSGSGARSRRDLSGAELVDLLALLRRGPLSEGVSTSLRYSPVHLPRRQRRLLRRGVATHRVLLNLAEVPAIDGHRDEQVVFVTGRWRARSARPGFSSALLDDVGVSPFLVVHDEARVLVALLSPSPARFTPKGSLGQTLEQSLNEIEILREPIPTLYPLLDHRYDRLLVETS